MTRASSIDRWLWIAFTALFGIVTLASLLPTRPIIFVFPVWSLVVLAAVLVTIPIVVITVRRGWPAEGLPR